MTPGPIKCGKCDRTFKMAAHLARHLNTTHGGKPRGPKAGKRARAKMKRGPGRPRGRGPGRPRATSAAAMGDGAIHLLSQMQSYISELSGRRDSLDAQIAGIENAMSSLGGTFGATRIVSGPRGARRGPGRPPGRPLGRPAGSGMRAGSLKDTIVRVLKQRSTPLSPKEIATAVLKAGYKTRTTDLSKAVSNALPEVAGIKKVGRGIYSV